ncbi:hypothetical protein MFFC18_26660 [Mariniblastus fucicola]|uniref:Uncharacterized protein n=1 Tax=Mariniblastus fucicola TaxID=980251 RepID=A0A5B9PJV5_9BACT|nr:hypothetical protein MFFC18_26660 [Mariniblastus fucicola]
MSHKRAENCVGPWLEFIVLIYRLESGNPIGYNRNDRWKEQNVLVGENAQRQLLLL